jgi:release factor glutamine methyltransferase
MASTNDSLHRRIAAARDSLVDAGVPAQHAPLDAEVLARHVLGWDRAELLARGREAPPEGFDQPFNDLIARRQAREPVSLIIGTREFWGLDFEVTRDVLVPRPETEFIVEEALTAFDTRPVNTIIDVGTGSGCIAVALAREFPAARVIATDISEAALAVARRNASRHGVADRIDFRRTNLLEDVAAAADLIVSNPPYVPRSAERAMAPEVLVYEPHVALFAGAEGLELVERILEQAASRIVADGRLILEFGFGQEADVAALAARTGWQTERVREDLQGIPRTIVLMRGTT